jgi:signal transduction histidine kinase
MPDILTGELTGLSAFELFAGLGEPGLLEWLMEKGNLRVLEPLELLIGDKQPIDEMGIVVYGKLEVHLEQNDGRRHLLVSIAPGETTGVLPYSRLVESTGVVVATERTQVLLLHRRHFGELVHRFEEFTERLVHLMTKRVRYFTAKDVQQEKLAALGTMAAGLAHELNNPAAALMSAGSELKRRHLNMNALIERAPEKALQTLLLLPKPGALPKDALDRMERADAMAQFLQTCPGVVDPDVLAEDLAEAGFQAEQMENFCQTAGPEQTVWALQWAVSTYLLEDITGHITAAASSISALVKAVKLYSHMDQAPVAEATDVLKHLRATMTLNKFSFKESKVGLLNELPETLPLAMVLPGELSQVWNNLLDNARYAAAERGQNPAVVVRAGVEGSFIWVEVSDNGGGIPLENLTRIFEPFFSTKGAGKGTGLGLELVRKSLNRQMGEISLRSEPGNTVFRVLLPLAGV